MDHLYVNEGSTLAVYSYDRASATFKRLQEIPPYKYQGFTTQLNALSYSASTNTVTAVYAYSIFRGVSQTTVLQFQVDESGQLSEIAETELGDWQQQSVPITGTDMTAISGDYTTFLQQGAGAKADISHDVGLLHNIAGHPASPILVGPLAVVIPNKPVLMASYRYNSETGNLEQGPPVPGEYNNPGIPVFSLDGSRVLVFDIGLQSTYTFKVDAATASLSMLWASSTGYLNLLGCMQNDTVITSTSGAANVELRHLNVENGELSPPWATAPVPGTNGAVAPDGTVIFLTDLFGHLSAVQLKSGQQFSTSSIDVPRPSYVYPYSAN